jgi:hypothetical protein
MTSSQFEYGSGVWLINISGYHDVGLHLNISGDDKDSEQRGVAAASTPQRRGS